MNIITGSEDSLVGVCLSPNGKAQTVFRGFLCKEARGGIVVPIKDQALRNHLIPHAQDFGYVLWA